MATLKAVRSRIVSVEKIRKIAKALEVVALTRLRRMEADTIAARVYFDKIRQLLFDTAQNINFKSHPFLLEHRAADKVGIVSIFSDKGLCGNFNANINSRLTEFISQFKGKRIEVTIIGKKGLRYLKSRGPHNIAASYPSADKERMSENIAEIAKSLIEGFLNENIDEIFLLYSRFRRHLLGEVKIIKLLPFTPPQLNPFPQRGRGNGEGQSYHRDYIYEPSAYDIFDGLVKAYVANQLHQGILESRCAEEMSRMLAMKSAADNADDVIADLRLTYHKGRQAQITKELTEVVAASEAA